MVVDGRKLELRILLDVAWRSVVDCIVNANKVLGRNWLLCKKYKVGKVTDNAWPLPLEIRFCARARGGMQGTVDRTHFGRPL